MDFKVVFDGPSKIIHVNDDVTHIDVELDIYMAWMAWEFRDEFPAPIRVVGGDSLDREFTKFIPKYFFIENDWCILIDSGKTVMIEKNIYTTNSEDIFVMLENNSNVVIKQMDRVMPY
jgi:hypothetical protein